MSCEFHVLLEVKRNGAIVLRHGHDDPTLLEESCVLDVADRGRQSGEEVGRVLGFTRQNTDIVGQTALRKLRAALEFEGVTGYGTEAEGNWEEGGTGDSGKDVEPGASYLPPGYAMPATRRPFLPPSHLDLVRALARRADPGDPSPPSDDEVERLRDRARGEDPEDPDGWCDRVWDAYSRGKKKDEGVE